MEGAGGPVWKGTRTPNRTLAMAVFAVAAVLVGVALVRWAFQGVSINWWAMVLVVVLVLAYAGLVLTTRADVSLALGEDALILSVREHAAGRLVRERTHRVSRDRMAKVTERVMGRGVHTVRVEDGRGRTLVAFPRFLEDAEHERMMTAILEWGSQPPSPASAPGSSPDREAR